MLTSGLRGRAGAGRSKGSTAYQAQAQPGSSMPPPSLPSLLTHPHSSSPSSLFSPFFSPFFFLSVFSISQTPHSRRQAGFVRRLQPGEGPGPAKKKEEIKTERPEKKPCGRFLIYFSLYLLNFFLNVFISVRASTRSLGSRDGGGFGVKKRQKGEILSFRDPWRGKNAGLQLGLEAL